MNERTFTNPVLLKAGTQKVSCLDGALDFLYDWPEDRRGISHATALRACQRALEGDYPLWFARDAFAAFAKWGKMLDDVSAPLPWMIDTSAGRGDLPA
jgi:hypothetical protein